VHVENTFVDYLYGANEMKEERIQILGMLKDGTITPDEAERLLAALADTERAQSQGSQRRHRTRFDFDFGDIFGTKGKSFTDIFDHEMGDDFQDKMRELRRAMRGAGQEVKRKTEEAMREAQESLKEAFEGSDLKDAFEQFGETVSETMEAILERVKKANTSEDEETEETTEDESS